MGERSHSYRIWWGKLRERDHTECPGIDGRKTTLNAQAQMGERPH